MKLQVAGDAEGAGGRPIWYVVGRTGTGGGIGVVRPIW